MALRKEPAERYASAAELARDLRDHRRRAGARPGGAAPAGEVADAVVVEAVDVAVLIDVRIGDSLHALR